jgi:putative transposase
MTDTIDDMAGEAAGQGPVEPAIDEQGVAEQLVAQAREKGIELVGPNGLLSQLTKRVLETARWTRPAKAGHDGPHGGTRPEAVEGP